MVGHSLGEATTAALVQCHPESLLRADASVVDPVLTGDIEAFLDPAVPFAVPSLVVSRPLQVTQDSTVCGALREQAHSYGVEVHEVTARSSAD